MGVAANCKMKNNVAIDNALTYDDIELPGERLIDTLRTEMITTFFK